LDIAASFAFAFAVLLPPLCPRNRHLRADIPSSRTPHEA
jgi:hypothetical protein